MCRNNCTIEHSKSLERDTDDPNHAIRDDWCSFKRKLNCSAIFCMYAKLWPDPLVDVFDTMQNDLGLFLGERKKKNKNELHLVYVYQQVFQEYV